MKLHQDQVRIGDKLYRYTLRDKGDSYELLCKVGTICPRGEGDDKVVRFDNGDNSYFHPKNDYSIIVDECYGKRVYLRSDDPDHAMELFIEYEEATIERLYQDIERHRDAIAKMKLS